MDGFVTRRKRIPLSLPDKNQIGIFENMRKG